MRPPMGKKRAPLSVFFAYAPADEDFCRRLETHLTLLKRLNVIGELLDSYLQAGLDIVPSLRESLARSDLILLLLSPDFIASDHCYHEMLLPALERHEQKSSYTIPILLRPVDFVQAGPWAKLQTLPRDGRFVSEWPNQDDAFRGIVQGIREVIEQRSGDTAPKSAWPDTGAKHKSQELHLAYARREVLQRHGQATEEVDQEILRLKRALRSSGQPKPGLLLAEGRYLLTERVGSGGFASVWKAFDTHGKQEVAIKILHANLAGDVQKRERFFRGARMMADLGHAGVVKVLEVEGEDDGWYYFVMEFVPGGNLKEAILAGKVGGEKAIDLLLEVAGVLGHAHERGIVHRDIKPANILLDEEGRPKLTDFDLVAAADTTGGTKTGAMGSFVYAAPELMDRPQDADARADVFGLGMTGIFCLYGKELPVKVFRDAEPVIRGLGCSNEIKTVLRRAVDWEVEHRFKDAGEFGEVLANARVAMVPWDARFDGLRGKLFLGHFRIDPEGNVRVSEFWCAYRAWDIHRCQVCEVRIANPQYHDVLMPLTQRAAWVMSRLDSEFVPKVWMAGVDLVAGHQFMVVTPWSARSLLEKTKNAANRGAIKPAEALADLRRVAKALDAIHAQGIVHCHVKQGIFYFTEDDSQLIISDFGLARVMGENDKLPANIRIVGTPEYMAPEQFEADRDLSPQTDLFALGLMAFEMLTGRVYWSEMGSLAISKHYASKSHLAPPSERVQDIVHIQLPLGFDTWFGRATDYEPQYRFQSAGEAIEELARVFGIEEEPAQPALRRSTRTK